MPAVSFYTLLEHALRLDVADMETQLLIQRMAHADKRQLRTFTHRLELLQRDILEENDTEDKDAAQKLKRIL